MKKLFILAAALMISGCALNCGEMMGKETMYKSGKHMVKSLSNPNEMTPADVKAEKEDGGWYGCAIKIGK